MSRLATALAVVVLVSGCAQPDPAGGSPTSGTPRPAVATATASHGERRELATDLEVPWDFAVLPDGSMLITLRDRAELVRLVPGEGVQPVAQVPGVEPGGEGGLLGVALSPRFAADQLIYLYFTAAGDNRVVRFRYRPDGLGEPTPVLTGIPKAGNHNGGRLRFGPDGYLYIGTGDAGRSGLAQDRDSLGGKILRVGADGSVPPDNPFGNPVYSYGHRNVQGLGWDAAGRLYASEFGQNDWDELNVITAGANYGWPQTEGDTDDPGVQRPLVVWRTAEASPSGLTVAGDGRIFIAALRGQRVWEVPAGDSTAAEPKVFLDDLGRIRQVAVVGGELLVLTNNTARGDPRPGDDRLVAVSLTG